MARREKFEEFIAELLEHADEHPQQYPVFFIAATVDPDTGQFWFCEHVLVSEQVYADVWDAVERGHRVTVYDTDLGDEPESDEGEDLLN